VITRRQALVFAAVKTALVSAAPVPSGRSKDAVASVKAKGAMREAVTVTAGIYSRRIVTIWPSHAGSAPAAWSPA
jgi:hypothetical protein